MKIYNIIILFLVFSRFTFGQPINLVPNHSFENATCDPFGVDFSPNDWEILQGSPDYYHSSFSPPCPIIVNLSNYQIAQDGLGFVGIGVYCNPSLCASIKESIQIKLFDTLNFERKYCVSFYVNLSRFSQYATDDIGVYFSNNSNLIFPTIHDVENTQGNFLTDTTNWILINGIYTATGDELYLNLGNFKLNSVTTTTTFAGAHPSNEVAYYHIDNVSVFELPEIDAGVAQTICPNATTIISANCTGCWQGTNYEWKDGQGNLLGTGSSLNVSPSQTTTYYVNLIDSTNSVNCAAEVIDSVQVSVLQSTNFCNVGNDIYVCLNDTVSIGIAPLTNCTYSWQPTVNIDNPLNSQTNLIVTGNQTYTLTQTELVLGCSFVTTDSLNVFLNQTLEANILENDTIICGGESITLNAQTYPNTSCSWYIDGVLLDNDCSYTNALTENKSIVLILTDNSNSYCIDKITDTIEVRVSDCDTSFYVSIPNVFSPNGDGINDVFEVKYKNAGIQEFVIYNRWGVKIYEGKNLSSINSTLINFVSWDGRTTSGNVCEDGTYFYVIILNGHQNENISYKGFLQLL